MTAEEMKALQEMMAATIRAEVGQQLEPIRQDIAGMKQGLTSVQEDVAGVKQGLISVQEDTAEIKADVKYMREQQDILYNWVDRLDLRVKALE